MTFGVSSTGNDQEQKNPGYSRAIGWVPKTAHWPHAGRHGCGHYHLRSADLTDNATYEKGTLPSTGIPYVVVNGTIVVKDSKVLKGFNPGQPIRFAQTNSRFEPITLVAWTHKFYAAPVDFGGGVPSWSASLHARDSVITQMWQLSQKGLCFPAKARTTLRLPMMKRAIEPVIAVVDDDESVGRSLARFLKASGFQSVLYSSAEALLADMEHRPLNCLIVDLQLGGMSGMELHARLTSAGVNIPMILMTARDEREIDKPELQAHGVAVLRKSDPGDELVAKLHLMMSIPASGNGSS